MRSGTPELALTRRYPALARLPRTPLITVPTPIEALSIEGAADGALFVKRDDRSSSLYGGNKARKLEFTLAAAAARGSRRLVTTGGIGTHHGLATTIFARTLGIATTVVVVPQPVTEHVREQVRAMLAFGADLRPASGVLEAAAQVVRVLIASTLRGEKPTLVATGGTSGLADLGFVSAALELAEQIEAGAMPEPSEVYVPIGSGGTLAGLVLGAKLAKLRTRFIGVLVTDILPPGPQRLARLARASLAVLRRFDASIPHVAIEAADFEVARTQLGAGYGATTAAAEAAIATARGAGLELEATYTAKCLAEILARLGDGRARPPALFWNTYNGADYWKAAPVHASEPQVPARIAAWLAGEVDMTGWSRRGFLGLVGSGAAFASLASLRAIPAGAAVVSPGATPFFDPGETEILTQIVERMVDTGEPGAPPVRDTPDDRHDRHALRVARSRSDCPAPRAAAPRRVGTAALRAPLRALHHARRRRPGRRDRRLDAQRSHAASHGFLRAAQPLAARLLESGRDVAADRLRRAADRAGAGDVVIEELLGRREDLVTHADVCVIGSGAGGAVAAAELASAGLDVVVLEQGHHWTAANFTQRENEMLPRLFEEAGMRQTEGRLDHRAPRSLRRRLDGAQPLLRVPHARSDPADVARRTRAARTHQRGDGCRASNASSAISR